MNISSFVGFLPADKPELAIIVVLDEPQGRERTGGAVSAPVFRDIATWLVRYLDVVPTRPAELATGLSGGSEHAAAAED